MKDTTGMDGCHAFFLYLRQTVRPEPMPALLEQHFSAGVVPSYAKKMHLLLRGKGKGCALYQRTRGLNGFNLFT